MKSLKLTLVLFVLILALNVQTVQAQSLSIFPNNSVTKIVESGVWLDLYVYMENLTNDTIVIEYSLYDDNLFSGWEAGAGLCDNQQCLSPPPASGMYNPIAAGDTTNMKMQLFTTIVGTGYIKYLVWDQANPSVKDTLTFNLEVIVGIEERDLNSDISVYPLPAQNTLNIHDENLLMTDGQLSVLDLTGKSVMSRNVDFSNGLMHVDISQLTPGIYLLNYTSPTGVFRKKFIKTL